MRFYEYKCIKCNKKKEFYEETDANKCIHYCECGGEMIRVISAPQFRIKTKEAYWDLSASERRRRWNSPDASEKI